jgi:hypothetical protein
MAGLVPATHTRNCSTERMGRRDKPGDDDKIWVQVVNWNFLLRLSHEPV